MPLGDGAFVRRPPGARPVPGEDGVADIDVVEFTDPVCSYAWGTEPKIRRLRWQYGHRLRWRRVMVGVLAPGWEVATGMTLDDPALPKLVTEYWRNVSELTAMPYPAWLSRTWVSSEEACRFAKAAERQDAVAADRILRRLRESWFVLSRPADTVERGLAAAAGVPGIDLALLARDAVGADVARAFRSDWAEARRPSEYVRNLADDRVGFGKAQMQDGRLRYGLPCVVLSGPGGTATIAGWRDWSAWQQALEAVAPGAVDAGLPLPTPAEAFATSPLLAPPELDMLCGSGAQPPPAVVTHDWGAGVVWMTEEEAVLRERWMAIAT
jgi:predicted DsbA family dithiol-disulfide isomerase